MKCDIKNIYKTKEIEEGVNIDFDEEGKVIGLEIIGVTQRYKLEDIFNITTKNLIIEISKLLYASLNKNHG